MVNRQIAYRALLIIGSLLFLIYLLAWIIFYTLLPPNPVHSIRDGRGRDDSQVFYYKITTTAGKDHIIPARANDPAGMLSEATRRFGEIGAINRISAEAAKNIRAEHITYSLWCYSGFLLVIPIAMIGAGLWLRKQQNRETIFWSEIKHTLGMQAEQLRAKTGLSDHAMKVAIDRINQLGLARLYWDTKSNRIYDTRLSQHSITINYCVRCNEPLNQRLLADLKKVPRCPACMFTHDRLQLDQLTADLVDQLHHEALPVIDQVVQERRFSWLQFLVLTLLFPPFAIVYALKR